jgi:magnesium-transporting ATPase (P-type)
VPRRHQRYCLPDPALLSELWQHQGQQWVNDWGKWDQHLLESVLLYLVTLSLLVQLFLFSQGAIPDFSYASDAIGIGFLAALVFFKRRASADPARQSRKSILQPSWSVRRGHQELKIDSGELKVGDILLIDDAQPLPADGILLKVLPSD